MSQEAFIRALIGGALIGAASAILFFCNGKVAGISGMIRRLSYRRGLEALSALLFLGGLVAGAWLFEHGSNQYPVPRDHFPPLLLAASALLVAIGTALSNGCTSGHGVCGLGRLSLRSLVAVAVFLVTAFITVYFARHVWGIL